MPPLTQKEMEEFLAGPYIARIATLNEDGSPSVVPVWYGYEEGSVYIIPRKRSRFFLNILRDPRVAVTIDEQTPPYRKVTIEGKALVEEQPNVGGRWVELGKRMAARYFGEELGPTYLKTTLDQPRALIRLPFADCLVTSWAVPADGKDISGFWHKRYYEPGTSLYESTHGGS